MFSGIPSPTFALDFEQDDYFGFSPAFSHTRATASSLVQQFDGSFVQMRANEFGREGGRRVRNMVTTPDITNAAWVKYLATPSVSAEAPPENGLPQVYQVDFSGQFANVTHTPTELPVAYQGPVIASVWLKLVSGNAELALAVDIHGGTLRRKIITVSSEWQRFEYLATLDAASVTNPQIAIQDRNASGHGSVLVCAPQLEAARPQQSFASEYVSRGVLSAPYHGWGVDGVAWFKTDEYGIRNDRGMRIHGLAPALSAWSYGPTLVSMEALPDGFVRASNVDSYDGQIGVNATILLSGHSPSRVGARVLLRAGPGSDRISLAFYNGAFADCTYRVLSGPGRFSGLTETTGTGRIISGLSLTEPTEVEFYMNGLSNPAAALNAYFYIDARSGGGNPATSVANEVKIGVVELLSPDADSVAPFDALSTVDYGFGVNGLRWVDGQWRSKYPVRAAGIVRRPAVTNIYSYSTDFTNAAWNKQRAAVSAGPVGLRGVPSTRVERTDGGGSAYISRVTQPTFTANTVYTLQAMVQAGEATSVELSVYASVGWAANTRAWFNLADGTSGAIAGTPAQTILHLGGGWYICTITATFGASTATSSYPAIEIYNNLTVGHGFNIDWLQINEGFVALPFVPTTTTAVTADADVIILDKDEIGYSAAGGAWVIEHTPDFATSVSSNSQYVLDLRTDSNNGLRLYNQSTRLGVYVIDGGVVQWSANDVDANWTPGEQQRIAVRFVADDGSLVTDGVEHFTDTGMSIPAVADIAIGGLATYSTYSGTIERIAYYAEPV